MRSNCCTDLKLLYAGFILSLLMSSLSGPDADVLVVYAKTDPNNPKPQRGISTFLIEKGENIDPEQLAACRIGFRPFMQSYLSVFLHDMLTESSMLASLE